MIDTYYNIKAYLTQYVLSDPRIPTNGFVWGQSKRILDAMAAAPIYPYFWVEEIDWIGQAYDSNTQAQGLWDLNISIKGPSMLGDIPQQEYWLNHTHQIMQDFIGWLMEQHNQGVIYFNLSRFQASMREVYEPDDNWGWNFRLQLGYEIGSWCGLEAADSYEVSTFEPVWVGGASMIRILIDSEEFATPWSSESQKAMMLSNLVSVIGDDASVTASTDGVYLYLRARTLGASITYNLTIPPDYHRFTLLFT